MIVVLMGVSGCGKTTVGRLLEHQLGWAFLDADDYHPPANVEKMRSGTPLTDDDRWPWLDRLNALLHEQQTAGRDVLLGCSALKQRYRDRLAVNLDNIRWVYLKGSFELIESRLQARRGHYMPSTLLRSQFAALEEPTRAIVADISQGPEEIALQVAARLRADQPL